MDVLDNPNIIVGNAFDITPGGVQVIAKNARRQEVLDAMRSGAVQVWVMPTLIPTQVEPDKIAKLGDYCESEANNQPAILVT